MADSFDAAQFKATMRQEWRSNASGWRRWHDMLEAEEAGQRHSARLVALAGIGPGSVVLDVAGGYGEPSLTAARAVAPTGRVVCTDLSDSMLDFGRERAVASGIDNVEFVEGDAEHLNFAAETFDAVLSRCGLMFLPDVAGALARLHSFLKPGGRLAASVWGPPQVVQFTAAVPKIMKELNLPPPVPGRPGIFALADADRLAALVVGAGFREVETGRQQVVFATPSPEHFTQFLKDCSPTISALVDQQPPTVQKRIWEIVNETWTPFQGADGGVRTVNEAIWVVGTK